MPVRRFDFGAGFCARLSRRYGTAYGRERWRPSTFRSRCQPGKPRWRVELEFSPMDAVPVRPSENFRQQKRESDYPAVRFSADPGKKLMFSRAYRAAITIPPLLWVAVFLLVPYALLFCYSFWSVSPSQMIRPLLDPGQLPPTGAGQRLLANSAALDVDRRASDRSSLCCSATPWPTTSRSTRQKKRAVLSAGDHPAVGQLPGACLRMEDHPGQ